MVTFQKNVNLTTLLLQETPGEYYIYTHTKNGNIQYMCNISRLHIAIPSSVGRPATVAGIQILVAYNSIFAHHG